MTTINKYFRDGNNIFDDDRYTYPSCINDNRAEILSVISSSYRARLLACRYDLYHDLGFESVEDIICADVFALIVKKTYEYDKLYGTLSLQYNPIENYNEVETETITDTLGATHTETNSGAHNDSTQYGADTNTRTAEISAENVGTFANADKTTDSRSAHTDATSYGAHKVETDGDEVENTHTRRLEKAGNIGVTTSQQMIRSEREDVARFSFIGIVASDIVNAICEGVF